MSVESSALDVGRSAPRGAVFLSYASQDAEAAKCIADALRGAGVEVWFDAEGGLEHGDAWDAKIRRQIKECVLFIPIISANTQAREEGYFRLEWDLAAERARTIATGVAFILPVIIDGTREPDALVPDRFRAVQWTKLPGGNVPAEVLQRFLKLWSHRTGALKALEAGRPRPAERELQNEGTPPPDNFKAGPKAFLLVAAVIALVVAFVGAWFLRRPGPLPTAPGVATASAQPVPQSLSEAQQLVAKARELLAKPEMARAELSAADELCKRASVLDPTDADVWATWSNVHTWYLYHGLDSSTARREVARDATVRAMQLNPKSFEARFAQALWWTRGAPASQKTKGSGQQCQDADQLFRELLAENPGEPRVLFNLGFLCAWHGKREEGLQLLAQAAANPDYAAVAWQEHGWYHIFQGNYREAELSADRSIAVKPYWNNLSLKILLALAWHGDLDLAQATVERLPLASRQEDWGVSMITYVLERRREPREIIRFLEGIPTEWLRTNWSVGPTALLLGEARANAGQPGAAQRDFRRALVLIDSRLGEDPNNLEYLRLKVRCLHAMGDHAEAENVRRALREIQPNEPWWLLARYGPADKFFAWAEASMRDKQTIWLTAASLRLDPDFDPMRNDPRFARLQAEADADPRLSPNAKRDEAPAEPAAKPAVPDEKSVAVLAFANLSDDKANEYFSDGISEELLNVLAKVPGLKVSARTSAFYFKGKDVPIPGIAQKLGVAYVVEGSVRKAGDKVRITAQLIKAADGFHVWSDTFTRDLKDVFAVQDEIAGLIAQNLSLKLSTTSPRKAAPVNPEAFELYVQARQAWNLRTAEGFAQAEQKLNRALVLAPDFIRARAALIDVVQMSELRLGDKIGAFGQRNSPELARLLGLEREVIAADPEMAEIHATLGTTLQAMWRKSEVEPAYRRAVELNPNYATGHHWLGMHLAQEGRMDEALAELKLASELDPLSFIILDNYGWLLNLAGRQHEALRYLDRALALNPGYDQTMRVKASVLAALGRTSEARALAKQVSSRERVLDVFMLADVGLLPEAKALLASLEPRSVRSSLIPQLAVGRSEDALNSLSDISGASYGEEIEVNFRPIFDPVRNDPRFVRYLATVGLTEGHARAQAWRAAHPPEKAETKP